MESSVELAPVDLDRQFVLPPGAFDIAILLGVLYHLRNPFYVLEELARRATYCLLSTRIARGFPNGVAMPPALPIAYLLGQRELNDDETNYFIFSECGLRTLLARTYWDVCDWMTVGTGRVSDPVRPDRDERFFCLMKSRYGQLPAVELVEGWHTPEGSGWRWTEREFAAQIHWQNRYPPATLTMDLFVPEELIGRERALRMSTSLNGQPLAPEVYESPGPKTLVRRIKKSQGRDFSLRVCLSGALSPDESDPRERGIVVNAIKLE
ncbi:MAG: hypothetical protein WDO73_04130 [Ignavibacteriota bacterium]